MERNPMTSMLFGRVSCLKAAILLSLAGAMLSCDTQAPEEKAMRIAKDGVPECVIAQGDRQTASDKLAVEELELYLGKITGAKFQVVEEKDVPAGKSAIYVGRTKYAEKAGLDFSTFGDEEWCERSVGDSLVIGGGGPRGALYGVYDFLETQLGCHWLSHDCEVIPKKAVLCVKALDARGKPAMPGRQFYDTFWARNPPPEDTKNHQAFQIRNRNNFASPDRTWLLSMRESRSFYHTFHWYVDPKVYGGSHPEYFSDDGTGKRKLTPPTQLCLSNQEVWKIALETLRKFIKEDRGKLPREKWPKVYDVSQMDDSTFICKCGNCLAVVNREGSESGLVLAFINYLAEEIAKEYPDIWIRTFAYVSTERPPKNIRPRSNVIVQYCDLYSDSDCYKPLANPVNKERLDFIKAWSQITPNLFVWDYWFMADCAVAPDILVDALYADNNLFAELRVLGVFDEIDERGELNSQCFMAMEQWLGYQLMLNPRRPLEPLIDLFIDNYYGSTAPIMRQYCDVLRAAVRDEVGKMRYTRKYVNADFLARCRQLLLRALAACKGDSTLTPRVQRELTVVDNCALNSWSQFGKEFEAGKLSKDTVLEEYKNARLALIEAYVSKESRGKKKENLDNELTILSYRAPPLPAPFSQLPANEVKDFAWPYAINLCPPVIKFMVEDPGSPVGKATVLYLRPYLAKYKKSYEQYTKPRTPPLVFGLYDRAGERSGPTITINPAPVDEKYHWYRIPEFKYGPGTILWGHESWLLSLNLYSVFVYADGVAGDPNVWDTWISVKMTGPAYVPGSSKEDAVWLDRVILTRPGKIDKK